MVAGYSAIYPFIVLWTQHLPLTKLRFFGQSFARIAPILQPKRQFGILKPIRVSSIQ